MFDRPMYYRRDGTPIPGNLGDGVSVIEWAKEFEHADRRVAKTIVDIPAYLYFGRVVKWMAHCTWDYVMTWKMRFPTLPSRSFGVSTVFLGLDHNFGGGPPLIFETMIFPSNNSSETGCWRYSTEAEALEGHRWAVHLLKSGYCTDEDDWRYRYQQA